jgi:chemotaxis protein CheC
MPGDIVSLVLSSTAETLLAHTFARAMRRAGAALGEMSGREIDVEAPEVRFCRAAGVAEMAGGPEAIVVGVYLGITGSLTGHAVLLLQPDGARRLARLLLDGLTDAPDPAAMGEVSSTADLLPLELSALQEVGNVTLGAFLNEIGRHLEEAVQPTVPVAIVEMAGAILDTILVDLLADTDEFLAARTTFREGDDAIDGTLLVLPRPASLEALVQALGAADR